MARNEWSAEDSLIATRVRDAADAGLLTWEGSRFLRWTVEREQETPESDEMIVERKEPVSDDEDRVIRRLMEEGHLGMQRGSVDGIGAIIALQS